MEQYLSVPEIESLGLSQVNSTVQVHRFANIVFPKNILIGDHVRIDGFTVIVAQSEMRIGSYVHIGSFVNIAGGGGVSIGNFSTLSQGVKIYSVSDDYSGESMTNPMVPNKYKNLTVAPVVLGDHVIVGSGCVVLPDTVIPDGVAIGALSLVQGVLEPWGIYAGIPARRIRDRSRKLLEVGKPFLDEFSKGTSL